MSQVKIGEHTWRIVDLRDSPNGVVYEHGHEEHPRTYLCGDSEALLARAALRVHSPVDRELAIQIGEFLEGSTATQEQRRKITTGTHADHKAQTAHIAEESGVRLRNGGQS